jgi:DNA modification methylase
MIDLRLGDCLEVMKEIPSKSIDAIITDPPYGTTACKWDSVIDFDLMWEQLNRIIKPNGAIVLFGSEPFSSALRMSNIKNYKYDWVFKKTIPSNPLLAKKQILKYHEIISIFYEKQPTFNPQKVQRKEENKRKNKKASYMQRGVFGNTKMTAGDGEKDWIFEGSVVNIKSRDRGLHPTQKPIELMEKLIKTYTNENERVLDFTMGSGTTMLACKNLNRNGIGIEKDSHYYAIAVERLGV